jgi:hypothetical protein
MLYGVRGMPWSKPASGEKLHYLDLAGGSDFVAGVRVFDDAAGAAGVYPLSMLPIFEHSPSCGRKPGICGWAQAPLPLILYHGLIGFAWLVRLRLIPSLSPFAPAFFFVISRVRWGEHREGVRSGTRNGPQAQRWGDPGRTLGLSPTGWRHGRPRRVQDRQWHRNLDAQLGGTVIFKPQFEGKGKSAALCERFGSLTFAIVLALEDNRLCLALRHWSFLGVALPMGRSKTVFFRFHVEIGVPWLGLIVRYQGWLVPAPAKWDGMRASALLGTTSKPHHPPRSTS